MQTKKVHARSIMQAPARGAAALFIAISLGAASTASAGIIGYTAHPTTNSIDWANAVNARGAIVNSTIDFNGMATGAVNGSYYALDTGVTMAASNIIVDSSIFGNGYAGASRSQGEGAWSPSRLLRANSFALSTTPPQSVTFAFDTGVYGGGIFLVDYNGGTPWTITAKDASNAILGFATSLTGVSFQKQGTGTNPTGPYKYFLGIESTEANIASLTISRPTISMYQSGDIVGLDDFRFAEAVPAKVPEPVTLGLMGIGLLGIATSRRRRYQR